MVDCAGSPPLQADKVRDFISKNEECRNKKLAYCFATASTSTPPAWASTFKTQIQTGEIKSLTKAKQVAVQLWRDNSPSYDKARAVQMPADNPGTCHSIKRVREEDETQYAYRKRRAAETRQIDQDDDLTTKTDHAIQIKDKMKKLLKMTI